MCEHKWEVWFIGSVGGGFVLEGLSLQLLERFVEKLQSPDNMSMLPWGVWDESYMMWKTLDKQTVRERRTGWGNHACEESNPGCRGMSGAMDESNGGVVCLLLLGWDFGMELRDTLASSFHDLWYKELLYLQNGSGIKWPLDYFEVVTLSCASVFKQSCFVFCQQCEKWNNHPCMESVCRGEARSTDLDKPLCLANAAGEAVTGSSCTARRDAAWGQVFVFICLNVRENFHK